MKRRKFIPAFLLGCGLRSPAQSRVGAPVLADVFDVESGLSYKLLGEPGSIVIASPTRAPAALVRGAVSADAGLVLGTTADGTARIWRGSSFIEQPLPVPFGADGVLLSANGSSGALAYSQNREVVVIAGLPDAAKVLWRAAFPFAGGVRLMAVRDDSVILQSVENRALWLVTRGRIAVHLGTAGEDSSAAFSARGAVVADPTAREINEFDLNGGAFVLASKTDGIQRPVAVAFRPEREQILIADAEAGAVIEISAGGMRTHPCTIPPSRLQSLGRGRYLLTGFDSAAVLILVVGTVSARIVSAVRLPTAVEVNQ